MSSKFYLRSLVAGGALGLGLAATAAESDTIHLKAMGQPLATGLIQKNIEQPFLENMAEETGLDVSMEYTPVDVTGIRTPNSCAY